MEEARLAARAAVRDREAEIEHRQAQAELDAHALRAAALARRVELGRAEREAALEARRAEAEVALAEGHVRAGVELAMARAERERLEGQARP